MSGLDIQTFHLGGNSMGGNIAGVYASKYPDQVKSLILIAPGGVASAETSELDRYLKEGNNPLIAKSSEEYDRLLDFVFLERPFIPGAVKKHLAQKAIERKDLNIAIFKQFNKTPDTLPLEVITKGLAVPTLIVWGADDRVLHVSGAKLLNAVIPGSRLAVMDHVGHLPMVEKPKETAGLCLNFIKRQP
jgi:pimeloyl-ACP methyl ester carboxylesterase